MTYLCSVKNTDMDFTHLAHSLMAIINEMSPYILLGFLIAGILHVFVRPETMSRHLAGNGWRPVVKAAVFGIPLPLCSCGVLPTAVSLRRQGASKSASTSFLIATPQTGVDSIAATYSLLGLPFAVIRPIAALVGAVAGGLAVGRWDREDSSPVSATASVSPDDVPRGFFAKMVVAVRYGLVDMVASVGKWLVIGLIVAALITVFVPDSLFLGLSRYPLLAMLVMVIVAVPMYICATGSIPIALSLMLKGLSPGVAFVLLMAGPAANFASIMILTRSHGRRTTFIYVASVIVIAIAFGLIIDYLLPAQWFAVDGTSFAPGCHTAFGWFETSCSVILAGLLVYAAIRHRRHGHHCDDCDCRRRDNEHYETDNNCMIMTREFKIAGMACVHCQARVEKAIAALPGVESVTVDLGKARATVTGDIAPDRVIETIRLAGYEYIPE